MKFLLLCLTVLLAAPCLAAPVHIALKPAAVAQPDGDGFLTLASVADLSGGDKTARIRLSGVQVARAPLSGESRRLTRGDLALKLRQAGCDPDTQVVFDGASQSDVTTGNAPGALPGIEMPGYSEKVAPRLQIPQSRSDLVLLNSPALPVPGASPLIHRGDVITIYIQSGPLTITAPGIARDNGGVGETIRVHREGVMTDLSVQVLDARTVRLEI